LTDAIVNAAEANYHGDPAARLEAAHSSAAAVVARLGAQDDPTAGARMAAAVDSDEGLEAAARLWAAAAPVSLPGALWRLVALRAGVRRDPVQAARDFDAGRAHVPVAEVVAGVADPPGPAQVLRLVDDVLRGIGGVDFDTALQRAAAFARILAVGRSFRADAMDEQERISGGSTGPRRLGRSGADAADVLTRSAAALVTTAGHLESAARHWRAGDLD
jgi:hypothetical protein